jgi:uncharacterized membrane protein YphA (DoxX/SURF4 family)
MTDVMAGYAESKGVPNARVATIGSGLLILVGAVLLILGVWPDLGALMILAFLVPTALLMHAFWKESDPGARTQEQIQFNKDVALAGAALCLFAFFAYAGDDLSLTLTGPLFSLS